MNNHSHRIKVKDLCCERQDTILFDDLNFIANDGELIRIHGENGSGKSSLLKIIIGLLKPLRGQVFWNNQIIADQAENFTHALTYIGHKPAVKTELTVVENIRSLLAYRRQCVSERHISDALAQLSLTHYEDVEAGFLSQGQQKRIALARLFLEDSQIWVLDEPYTALDKKAIELINQIISSHLKNGNIVILTSHQETQLLADDVKEIWLSKR